MKTLKSVLFATAATTALTLMAAEPLQTPRASGLGAQTVAGIAQDPNLVGSPRLGKYTQEPVVTSIVKDQNIAARIANCPMAPRTKDTPACKQHCEAMARK
jgi:hypothetical protein